MSQSNLASIVQPWMKFYPKEVVETPLPETTLYLHLCQATKKFADIIAFDYYGTKKTYSQMMEEIDRTADALVELGVRQGDYVTVVMLNNPEFIYLIYALNKIGAVVNCINPLDRPEFFCEHVEAVDSKYIFILDFFLCKFANELKNDYWKKIVVCRITESMSLIARLYSRYVKKIKPIPLPNDERFTTWKEFSLHSSSTEKINPVNDADAPAVIIATSGTTGGRCKQVLFSSKAITTSAKQCLLIKEVKPGEKMLAIIPLFCAFGINTTLHTPLIGGLTLIIRIPGSEGLETSIRQYKVNHIVLMPYEWTRMMERVKKINLSCIKEPTCGSDILTLQDEKNLNKYLYKNGCKYNIFNGYGMTEGGAALTVNNIYGYKEGSVGIPLCGTVVSVFDENQQELPLGQTGEVCVQTPGKMIGYINLPAEDKNKLRIHPDGSEWLHSNDFGHIDEDGFLFFESREQRAFYYMFTGEMQGVMKKIKCVESEKVLLSIPGVKAAAVVPRKDHEHLSVPIAFVVLEKDEDKEKAKERILAYCNENAVIENRPVELNILPDLPRTPMGKTDFRKLTEIAVTNSL